MQEKNAPERIDPQSLGDYLEVMSKAVFQAGMSWQVVGNKWPDIREAFRGFDAEVVAAMGEPDLDALAKDTRVIRNARKLAAIVGNAGKMLELEAEHGALPEPKDGEYVVRWPMLDTMDDTEKGNTALKMATVNDQEGATAFTVCENREVNCRVPLEGVFVEADEDVWRKTKAIADDCCSMQGSQHWAAIEPGDAFISERFTCPSGLFFGQLGQRWVCDTRVTSIVGRLPVTN